MQLRTLPIFSKHITNRRSPFHKPRRFSKMETRLNSQNISLNFQHNSTTNQEDFKELTLVQVLNNPTSVAVAMLLFLLTISSIFGNAVVCRTIFITKRLHTPGYYFVASLAVADLLVGVVPLPLTLAFGITKEMKGRWIFGEAVCDASVLATIWFCCASIFSLCGVTWDRYMAVTSPLRYTSRMTNNRVTCIIVAIWVSSLVFGIFNSYGLKTLPGRVLCDMHEIPLPYNALDFVFLWLLPIAFVVFVNGKIWKAASRHMRRIQAQTPVESLRDNSNYQDVRNDITDEAGNGYCQEALRECSSSSTRLKGKMAKRNNGIQPSNSQDVTDEPGNGYCQHAPRECSSNSSRLKGKVVKRNNGIQPSNSQDVTDEPGNNYSPELTNNSTTINENITRTNHNILSTTSQENVAKDVTENPGNDNPHSHPREWTNNRSSKVNENITRTNHGAPFTISQDFTSAVINEQESSKSHPRQSCINKNTRLNRSNLRRIHSIPLTFPRDQRARNSRLRKEIKTFRTFLIVIGCFFISWTPFFWVVMVGSFIVVHKNTVTVCGFVAYMNSAYNPLIYGIFNRDFRQALFDSIRRRSRVSTRISKQQPSLHRHCSLKEP